MSQLAKHVSQSSGPAPPFTTIVTARATAKALVVITKPEGQRIACTTQVTASANANTMRIRLIIYFNSCIGFSLFYSADDRLEALTELLTLAPSFFHIRLGTPPLSPLFNSTTHIAKATSLILIWIALAKCVLLSGQNLEDYQFEDIPVGRDTIATFQQFGFTSDEKRQEARRLWSQWKASQKRDG